MNSAWVIEGDPISKKHKQTKNIKYHSIHLDFIDSCMGKISKFIYKLTKIHKLESM